MVLEIRGVPKEERQAKAEKALENSSLIAFKTNYQVNYLVGCNNVSALLVPWLTIQKFY